MFTAPCVYDRDFLSHSDARVRPDQPAAKIPYLRDYGVLFFRHSHAALLHPRNCLSGTAAVQRRRSFASGGCHVKPSTGQPPSVRFGIHLLALRGPRSLYLPEPARFRPVSAHGAGHPTGPLLRLRCPLLRVPRAAPGASPERLLSNCAGSGPAAGECSGQGGSSASSRAHYVANLAQVSPPHSKPDSWSEF